MKKVILIIICLSSFLIGCSNNKNDIQEYQDKIRELENRIYDLELELKWEKEELDSCKSLLKDYENDDDFIPDFTDY